MSKCRILPNVWWLASLLLVGCSDTTRDHSILKYFPNERTFQDGYVNKYYEHYVPVNKNATSRTRISYKLFKKLDAHRFKSETYNAGFELVNKSHYHVDENSILLDSSFSVWRTDTAIHRIKENFISTWHIANQDNGHYAASIPYKYVTYNLEKHQNNVYDSLINDTDARVFVFQNSRDAIQEDTTSIKWTSTSYYVKELGFFGMKEQYEEFSWEVELVEQMPLSKFESLASRKMKRVAYIDPKEAIMSVKPFEPCGHETIIADYYNSTPDGSYIHGKAALVDSIFANLESDKLMNQTGMLTFRFIVNCEGKAGRFIAEGYDYNYKPISFPKETIHHLHTLLANLREWRPVVIKEEPRDAYFYYTFKLVNGEITDILP